jgi:hypothetical protein
MVVVPRVSHPDFTLSCAAFANLIGAPPESGFVTRASSRYEPVGTPVVLNAPVNCADAPLVLTRWTGCCCECTYQSASTPTGWLHR